MADPNTIAKRVDVRPLHVEDLPGVVRIDAHLTREEKPDYWRRIFAEFLAPPGEPLRIGLAADRDGELAGYLFGEVRAFEFGSEACGWIFSVAVAPSSVRSGVATALLEEACRRFRDAGVRHVRTMVLRNDVPVLSFFRSNRFRGGSFVQLERPLDGVEVKQ